MEELPERARAVYALVAASTSPNDDRTATEASCVHATMPELAALTEPGSPS